MTQPQNPLEGYSTGSARFESPRDPDDRAILGRYVVDVLPGHSRYTRADRIQATVAGVALLGSAVAGLLGLNHVLRNQHPTSEELDGISPRFDNVPAQMVPKLQDTEIERSLESGSQYAPVQPE